MHPSNCVLAVVSLCLAATASHAQSTLTLYGVVDIALHLDSNAGGGRQVSLGPGATGGSRFGFKGVEDLGSGLSASFRLEAGYQPDTGLAADPARAFNRESWVGLGSPWGELRAGRQLTTLFEHFSTFDPMYGVSNVNESVPYLAYSAGDDPVHKDNAMRFGLQAAGTQLSMMAAPGEVPGHTGGGTYLGLGAQRTAGPNGIGAFYEQRDAGTGTAAAAGSKKKKTWGLGGSYQAGPVVLFANYQNHNAAFPIALELRGHLASLGAVYPLGGAWTLFAAGYLDRQKNDAGLSARRQTLALSLNYQLSRRTSLYAYADTTRWRGGYVEIMGNDYGAKERRSNLLLGMRHNF